MIKRLIRCMNYKVPVFFSMEYIFVINMFAFVMTLL